MSARERESESERERGEGGERESARASSVGSMRHAPAAHTCKNKRALTGLLRVTSCRMLDLSHARVACLPLNGNKERVEVK